jgi:hypothetical protein
MIGENFVSLVGKVVYPNLRKVGDKNSSLFSGSLAIPTGNGKSQYVKISAWNANADALSEVSKDSFVKIHGHIEERSYDGRCKHCGGFDKKYWTDVVVDNFIVVEE